MSDSRGTDADDGPSYCSDCGSALDPGDRFCSRCGARVAPPAGTHGDGAGQTGGDATDRDREAFRRRVNDYLADGWEIQYDAGDEVVLVDREFGSVGVHAALLLFTSGIGNLLYGWYKYSRDADRVVVRAGEDVERLGESGGEPIPDDESGGPSLVRYAVGLSMLLFGAFVVGTSLTSLGGVLFGAFFVALSLLVLPPTRRRIRDRRPPTTFGPTGTVEERAVRGTDRLCAVCRDPIDRGVVREYEKEYVLAGIPLYTIEAGENWYCESCDRNDRGPASGHVGFRDTLDDGAGGITADSTGDEGATRESE